MRIVTSMGKAMVIPVAVLLVLVVFTGNCAFTSQVVNRTPFDEPEMMFDNLLPDRDLPDKPAAIVSEWGAGAGGGAVGGCWSCG